MKLSKWLLLASLFLPLSVSAEKGSELNDQLQIAASKGEIAQITQLLEQGADINTTSRFGKTPVMQAAESGKSAAIALLLSRGANVNFRTKSGSSALIFAAENGFPEVTAMLVEMGANIHDRTRTGWDAMMIAARDGHDVIVAQLLEFGADVRASDRRGNGALMYAIEGGHENVVSTLFQYSKLVSPCVPNDQGITPLMMAIDKRKDTIVKLLLPFSKNISHQDKSGDTALHRAVELSNVALVSELLAHNASTEIKNEDGKTVQQLAEDAKNTEIIDLLKKSAKK
ncbi:MAG: ankyrin repeat domain-containing protein [Thiotrichaceae bacterium]|nr:ankyrin repeat domain-containing protein [Thiotrichaceae bacterium]